MSVIQTGTPDLAALQAQFKQMTGTPGTAVVEQPVAVPVAQDEAPSLVDRFRHVIGAVDEAISANPKLAVATAAVAGGLLASRRNPVAIAQDVGRRVMGTLAAGGAGLVAVHAALAHVPEIVSQVASTLAISPGLAEGAIVAGTVGLCAYLGNAIARSKGVEKAGEPAASGEKTSVMSTLQKGALAVSGIVAGGLLATGLVALIGASAPLTLAGAAAIGVFGGTMIGPVADEGHLKKNWLYALSFSLLPAALAVGHNLGAMDMHDVGPAWGTVWGGVVGIVGSVIATGTTHDYAKS